MTLKRRISDLLVAAFNAERRLDPYFRDAFDRVFQKPIELLVQSFINLRRRNQHLSIAEEQPLPNEEAITAAITAQMAMFLRKTYQNRYVERAGNTKTYGIVRADFEVLPDLPPYLRHGIFEQPRTYRAWVRFAGPGPLAPPDLEDNGVLSIGIKLMGVEGSKLLDDERMTQDFSGISAPTFTTPNIVENLKLQRQVYEGTPIFYFIQPFDSHIADGIMQGLYSKTHANPLEVQYYSCVAYLLGTGQAMQYTIKPRSPQKTRVPKQPSANYLREAMAGTLSKQAVSFDFMIQLQTDPHRMPIEDASVRWPEHISPIIPVARLRIPAQKFDSPGQLSFAGNLAFNPWHSLPAHRPLGNQNRARKAIYLELSRLRQSMNSQPHIEPTGDERFDD
jgi:hypothetical protein